MIPPVVNYTIELNYPEPAYSLFCRINDLNLSDNLFDYNKANLVAILLQTEPLVYKFRNQRYVIGRSARYGATYIIATCQEVNGLTTVKMRVCTNPFYYAYYAITLMFIIQAVATWSADTVYFIIAFLVVTAGLDVFSKAHLLARVKSVLGPA
jgi:hypothetical protein